MPQGVISLWLAKLIEILNERYNVSAEIDLEYLQKQLAELIGERAKQNAAVESQRTKIADIADALNKARESLKEMESASRALRRDQMDLESEVEKAKRKKELEDEQRRLLEKFAEEAKRLDELTANAEWRNFAKDYQVEGAKKLAVAKRGMLADKRGLGKTLSSLIWLEMVQAKKVLVIAPNDVVPEFEGEIRKWAPHRTVFSLRGLDKAKRNLMYPLLSMVDEFIITLNYEAWRKDKSIIDDLVNSGIDTIITDEAHRIKASDKLTARGVFELTYRANMCPCGKTGTKVLGIWGGDRDFSKMDFGDKYCRACGSREITSSVENVLCMSGTPILNKPQEIFSELYMINKKLFPSEKSFLNTYCYNVGGGNWVFSTGGMDALVNKIQGFFVQRSREDVGNEVPPPDIKIHRLDKDLEKYPLQYKAEDDIKNAAQLVLKDGEKKNIMFVLELILRERQCMTWPAGIKMKFENEETGEEHTLNFDVHESQKLDAAAALLDDLIEEGERTIVFSQFTAPLLELERRLTQRGVSVATVIGNTSAETREMVTRDFDLKTAPPVGQEKFQVLLGTYKVFGTGKNLNAARQMILLDDEWNPGMEDQAIGRIDRINSTDQATVHIFRVNDSVDDFMEGIMEKKRKMTDQFGETVKVADLLSFFEG